MRGSSSREQWNPPSPETAACALTVALIPNQAAVEPSVDQSTPSAAPLPPTIVVASKLPSRPLTETPAAPRAPPAGGFGDEFSCGVTEFLRRVGIGRTKLYELIDAEEIETFLLDGKRMILIHSWLALVARCQAAERGGEFKTRWCRIKTKASSPHTTGDYK